MFAVLERWLNTAVKLSTVLPMFNSNIQLPFIGCDIHICDMYVTAEKN